MNSPDEDFEDTTRPDNVPVRQWRQMVEALRQVPHFRREAFLDAVRELVGNYCIQKEDLARK